MKKTYLIIIIFVWLSPLNIYAQNNPCLSVERYLSQLDRGQDVVGSLIEIGDLNFETGSSTLNASARQSLDCVVRLLNRAGNINLNIKGHTDSQGSNAVNERLSTERAENVRTYLLQKNIAINRLHAIGYGSSQPKVPNDTPENRSKNRRVELEIVKVQKEEVKTLQDFLVLKTGEIRGVIIVLVGDASINYRTFSSDQVYSIDISKVDKIIYASGEERTFSTAPPPPPPPPAIPKDTIPEITFPKLSGKAWMNKYLPMFKQSAAFKEKTGCFQIGYGLRHNLGKGINKGRTPLVPSLSFGYEKNVIHNLGVGFILGTDVWKDSETKCYYQYYTVGLRSLYHFNAVLEQLDPYAGFGITYRGYRISSSGFATYDDKFSFDFIVGLRYYIKSWGVFIEAGSDATSFYKMGVCFKINRKKQNISNQSNQEQ